MSALKRLNGAMETAQGIGMALGGKDGVKRTVRGLLKEAGLIRTDPKE